MAITLAETILMTSYYSIVGVFGLFSNIWILAAMCKSREYRDCVSAYYLFNILFVSILACIFEVPYYIAAIVEKWPGPSTLVDKNKYVPLCQVSIFLFYTISTLKIYLLTAMSIDRFIAVLYPYVYKEKTTKTKVFLVILFVWLISFAITIPLPSTEGLITYLAMHGSFCGVVWSNADRSYVLLGGTLVAIFPPIVMLVTNLRVYKTARKQARLIHQANIRYTHENGTRNRRNKDRATVELATEVSQKQTNRIDRCASTATTMQAREEMIVEDIETVRLESITQSHAGTDKENDEHRLGNNVPVATDHHNNVARFGSKKEECFSQNTDQRKTDPGPRNKSCEGSFSSRTSSLNWSIICSTLLLVLTFFVTWLPFIWSRIYETFSPIGLSEKVVLYTTASTLLDNVLNPVIMLATRKKLRTKCLRLLLKKTSH
eukprot:gene8049-8912_t